jgi:hypothetical protein
LKASVATSQPQINLLSFFRDPSFFHPGRPIRLHPSLQRIHLGPRNIRSADPSLSFYGGSALKYPRGRRFLKGLPECCIKRMETTSQRRSCNCRDAGGPISQEIIGRCVRQSKYVEAGSGWKHMEVQTRL